MGSRRSLLILLVISLTSCAGRPDVGSVVLAAPTVRAQAPAESAARFTFPDDQAGKLLGELLPADGRHVPLETATKAPKPMPAPLIGPLGLPALQVQLPRLTLPASSKQPLLAGVRDEPLPGAQEHRAALPTGPLSVTARARVVSADANQPVPLPILAQQCPERIALDDVTAEISLAAATQAPPPNRAAPAPFVRLSIPDPFEHRHLGQPQTAPVDAVDLTVTQLHMIRR